MTLRAQMWFIWFSSWVLRCIMKPFILLRWMRKSKKLPPISSNLLLHSATTLAHMIRTRQVRISQVAIDVYKYIDRFYHRVPAHGSCRAVSSYMKRSSTGNFEPVFSLQFNIMSP